MKDMGKATFALRANIVKDLLKRLLDLSHDIYLKKVLNFSKC